MWKCEGRQLDGLKWGKKTTIVVAQCVSLGPGIRPINDDFLGLGVWSAAFRSVVPNCLGLDERKEVLVLFE